MSGSTTGAGNIEIAGYPVTNRVPGVYAVVDASNANTGQLLPLRTQIIGNMLSSGSYTANVPVLETGIGDTQTGCGLGSVITLMVEWYLRRDPNDEIWLLPVADNGSATKSVWTITPAAATYACLTSFVLAAHATGWKISVGTMLPRGELTGNATLQTQWNAYNALIRANTAGADYLIDFQADHDMGVLANVSNTSLYADQIHPTNYGANILYMIEDAVLTPVFP
jgi:phage tail sheath gpL-like